MILILAHHHDAEADWLYGRLKSSGRGDATLLCPEALGVDYSVSLRLRDGCRPLAALTFFGPDGACVRSSDVRYVVNRLSYIDPLVWSSAAPEERTYAASELNAFFPALVASFECGIDNPIRNGALWTHEGFASGWAVRIGALGVPIHPLAVGHPGAVVEALRQADSSSVRRWMVFDGQVLTPPGQAEEEQPDIGRAISTLAPGESLEFVAVRNDSHRTLRLLHVSPTAALSCYGARYIEALRARAAA